MAARSPEEVIEQREATMRAIERLGEELHSDMSVRAWYKRAARTSQ